MAEKPAAALTYTGALVRRDTAGMTIEPGDGAQLEFAAADIVHVEELEGPMGIRTATITVRPAARITATFRADSARLETAADAPLPLIAYERGGAGEVSVVPGEPGRDWMDATPGRFAYRCLPLLIANQSGWMILNPWGFTATWNGGPHKDDIVIEFDEVVPGRTQYVVSHFGSAVMTFSLPYLFRTPAGYNMYVRGPANMPKDAIAALEGIVETDWSDATFTMNWKFTRANVPVRFEMDEPVAMLSPLRRGEAERFRPVFRALEADKETEAGFLAFNDSRREFNRTLAEKGADTNGPSWQRHYMRGETVAGKRAREHQTAVTLARFVEEQTTDT